MSRPLLFGEELGHELVVGVLQLSVHAGHHADVVIVNQVNLFVVQNFGQLARLIRKEEVTDCLRLKRKLRTQPYLVCTHYVDTAVVVGCCGPRTLLACAGRVS